MENYPKILSRKFVFDGAFLKLSQVELQLANGKRKKHYNVERVPTVTVLPLSQDYELYLISQYRYLYEKVMFESVAGTIDGGESPLDTAKRELKEEAGIEAKNLDQIAQIYLAASYIKSHVTLFLARDLTIGEAMPEEDESIELIKLPLEDAVEKVILGEIYYAPTVVGILLLDKLRRNGKI